MAILSVAVGFLLAAQSMPLPNDASPQPDSWWECYYFFRAGDGGEAASGRLTRSYTLEGEGRSAVYEIWPPGLRVHWRLADSPRGMRPLVSYLSIEIPTAFPRNGGGIHGYLYADGAPIATTTMLDEQSARRGYAVSTVFFESIRGQEIGVPLAEADRWSLVVLHADGTEILRRDLPIPDRRTRDESFARHWTALVAAWVARDPNLLITARADSLPRDRGTCLLSTPAAREEMADSSISAQ